MPKANTVDDIWARVEKTDTCWLWTGYVQPNGYGALGFAGQRQQAHRLIYEISAGPIPDGLTLDHLCRVRHCVNPEHLEPVTNIENVMRGEGPCAQNARKTHCKRGHEFTPENTKSVATGRSCRACLQLHWDAANAARSERKAVA